TRRFLMFVPQLPERRKSSRKARYALALLACLPGFYASSAHAETIKALQGLKPMDASALESYHATGLPGFRLPNGVVLNIGFDIVSTINGIVQSHLHFATDSMPSNPNEIQFIPGYALNLQKVNGKVQFAFVPIPTGSGNSAPP